MLTAISILKSLKSFFTSKLGLYILIVIFSSLFLYFIYDKGYDNGLQYQKKEYEEKLKEAIDKQIKKSKEEQKIAIDVAKKEIKTEVIYKDKIKIVEKIINDNPKLKSKECSISKVEVYDFNKILDSIK